ncbi:CBM96 family carbohydrate-binding protein [Neorhodopirellula lusitana]|uniref:CBM96 family carbohydrate-binding protein n=1 Tax=Neorhodopirellula lusitana TaxID=445327 RepID=UPI003850179F
MNENRFGELLAAYLDDAISHEETTELHEAVKGSKMFRRQFQQETRLNVLMRETLAEQVELRALSHNVTPPGQSRLRRRLILAASAAVLLVSITAGYFVFKSSSDGMPGMGVCMNVSGSSGLTVIRDTEQYQAEPEFGFRVGDRIVCDAQTQAMLRLIDGSIVSMEPGAELVLNSDRPAITLQHGIAFFEIAPRRPGMLAFEVLTGNSTVAVMGTVFSVSASTHTELKVYEGSVKFTRKSDQAFVEVGSHQMATTEKFAVEELTQPSLEVISLIPTDDLALNRGQPVTKDKWLKVEGNQRDSYLRFVIPQATKVHSAKLRLKQDVDSGKGTLRFFVGDHSDWTEDSLNGGNAPKCLQQVAQHKGIVGRGQLIEVDVSKADLTPGPITIVMTLDETDENDIWFASRESDAPPELILTLGK